MRIIYYSQIADIIYKITIKIYLPILEIQICSFQNFLLDESFPYYGLLYKIPNGKYTKERVVQGSQGKETPDIDDFRIPFNYHIWRSKTWPENVAHAVSYIMEHDMSLLIKYYKQQSHIESYVFDGEYLIIEFLKMAVG